MRLLTAFLATVILAASSVYADEVVNPSCDKVCEKMRQLFEQKSVVRVVALGGEGGLGTGVILKEGILTNNHVIEGALKIMVEFYGTKGYYDVTVVGRDPAADLALLTLPSLPREIVPASLGDAPQIGDVIFALGHPAGIRSITFGYVNALRSSHWLYILTQAPLAPGSSGGPLFSDKGSVAGINTAIASVPGTVMSFTLSADHIKRILPRMMRERVVRHGVAGFAFADASRIPPPILERHGLPYPPEDGVMVLAIQPNSSPDRAGIRPGDYIAKFNGAVVKNLAELDKRIFFDHRPDDEVEVELRRGHQVFRKKFLLSEYVSPLRKNNNEK